MRHRAAPSRCGVLAATLALVCAAASGLSGCETYSVRGRVVQGEISYIAVVERDDPRLDASPLAGAQLRLQLDPGTIKRRTASFVASGPDGAFALPVDEFGAGVLEFDAGLRAMRRGYQSTEGTFPLPSSGQRVLVVMAPGKDPPGAFEDPESIMDEVERFR